METPSSRIERLALVRRRNPTPAEAVLGRALLFGAVPGTFWRSQHCIGREIVDFCCVDLRLVVELDGAARRQSRARTRLDVVERHGYEVLSFVDLHVLDDCADVVRVIREHVVRRTRATNERLSAPKRSAMASVA
jgi:very-short-patch-repair endonuclease